MPNLIVSRNSLMVEHLNKYSKYGLIIFGTGVFFDLVVNYLPGALRFFAFILRNFKYVGAIILFFSSDFRSYSSGFLYF